MTPRRGLALALGLLLGLLATEAALAEMRRPPGSFRGDAKRLAELAELPRETLPAVDVDALRAEDAVLDALGGGPYRFAAPIAVNLTPASSGEWERARGGVMIWRLRLSAPGASSLNLYFSRFELPVGAGLWIYSPDRRQVEGPYTRLDGATRRLWTPVILGDEVVVEVNVRASAVRRLGLALGAVNFGYRGFGAADHGMAGAVKQLACNNDVICPEAEPWRREVRAAARLQVEGVGLCSGALLNNTAEDAKPYLLTAYHCGISASNDDSLVVYWNYESPACGQLGGGSLSQTQVGATLRARWRDTDFALVELARVPDAGFGVYYAGWNATGAVPQAAVGIHHPGGEEKAISYEAARLGEVQNELFPTGRLTHWRVNSWDDGTTELGSSGSCAFDPADHRCFGQLGFGTDGCNTTDGYGKLSESWTGGGDAGSRLRDWLDPTGSGALTLGGFDPVVDTSPCVADLETMCLLEGRYEVAVAWSNQFNGTSGAGGAQPFTDFSGSFHFTDPANLELILKILDFGGGVVKVFYSQLTNLQFTMTVREVASGRTKTYGNTTGNCGTIDQDFLTANFGPFEEWANVAAEPGGLRGNFDVIAWKSEERNPAALPPCRPGPTTLCLLDRRFQVEVDWRNHFNNRSGQGQATTPPLSNLSSSFFFTDSRNVELLVKTLDFGDRTLFLWGALSDIEYTLTVTDTNSGVVKTYLNPAGRYCGGIDDNAFGGGGTSVLEVEPNDSLGDAQAVGGRAPITVEGAAEAIDTGTLRVSLTGGILDDIEDLYRVTTTVPGLRLSLTGLSEDCDLYLFRAQGSSVDAIDSSIGTGTADESIEQNGLAPGTYYVGVSIYDPTPTGDSTPYVLTLDGTF